MINYTELLNHEVANVKPSGIRRFFEIAAEIDDVISLSIGEPDFATPWHIREAGMDTLEKGRTWYSPNRGFMELREAITKWMILPSPMCSLAMVRIICTMCLR